MSGKAEFRRTEALLVTDHDEYFEFIRDLLENNQERRKKVTRVTSEEFAENPSQMDVCDILLLATTKGLESIVPQLSRRRPVLVLTGEHGFEVSHEVLAWLCSGRFMVLPARPKDPATIARAVFTLCRASLSILLVDDDRDDQVLVEDVLNRCPAYNVQLTCVDRPRKVRDALAKQVFDMLIFDFNLQDEMNGLQWIQRLQEEDCEIPMLLLSGHSTLNLDFNTGNALARGRATFLSKQGLDTDVMTQAIINTRSRTLLKR